MREVGVTKYLWLVLSTVAKFTFGLVLYKVVATGYGIEHLGVLGQILSLSSIAMVVSNCGLSRGIVQAYSSSLDDSEALQNILDVVKTVCAVTAVCLGFICVSLAKPMAAWLLGGEEYSFVLYLFGFSQLFMGLNSSGLAIAIATDNTVSVSRANVFASLTLIMSIIVCYSIGVSIKTLFSVVVIQSVILFGFICLCSRVVIARIINSNINFALASTSRYLFGFSLAVLLPVLMIQFTFIFSRYAIGSSFDSEVLGLWESTMKLDDGVLQLVALPLIYFFLPTVSKPNSGVKAERTKYLVFFFGLYLFLVSVFFAQGHIVLSMLYSPEASVMAPQMVLVFLAGMCRLLFVINQYLFLAKNMINTFLKMEVTYYLFLFIIVLISCVTEDLELFYKLYVAIGALISFVSYMVTKNKKLLA